MKKTFLFFSAAILALLVFGSFILWPSGSKQDQTAKVTSLPADVGKIVEKSCFGCHNSQSRNDKAKEKLDFDGWSNLNPMQKAGKTKAILDVLEKGTMPPPMFLERFPDRKLTDDEAKLLKDWAKKELGQ
jgi:hypothetical protein